jgi:sodium-dependent phosphate cotransporter
VTALLAALGTGSPASIACALGHVMFNVLGTCIFWPLQFIPISLAKGFARLAARRRIIAILFLIGLFFVLPLAVIGLTRWLGGS